MEVIEREGMDNHNDCRVVINISGNIFETYETTLARFPTTLLADKKARMKYFSRSTQQFFFQRNAILFESIIYFYQSNGSLNCPLGMPVDMFESDCTFFCIPRPFIDKMLQREGFFPDLFLAHCNTVDDVRAELPLRLRVWNVLENPNTSR